MAKSKIKKHYKFIAIRDVGEKWADKPIYEIYNRKSGKAIANLSWDPQWKTYVFCTMAQFQFDVKCLEDIVDFMKNEIQ